MNQSPGAIGWIDLTVPDATGIRDFYAHVAGWKAFGLSMGGYEDFCMNAENGQTVSGICHARGENQNMPPVWMIYITVRDLDDSVRRCLERGGKIRVEARSMGGQGRFCVIEDPAGACAGLYEPGSEAA